MKHLEVFVVFLWDVGQSQLEKTAPAPELATPAPEGGVPAAWPENVTDRKAKLKTLNTEWRASNTRDAGARATLRYISRTAAMACRTSRACWSSASHAAGSVGPAAPKAGFLFREGRSRGP